LIEQGDFAYRQMSNGGEEYFEILDPGFIEAMQGLSAMYQMKVRKVAPADARQLLVKAQNENQSQAIMGSEAWKKRLYERFEQLGFNRVKSDLENAGGIRDIGGPPENRELGWKWLGEKQAEMTVAKAATPASEITIADSRLDELRALTIPGFDLSKLVRMCEEINAVYADGCYFATGMLTRAVLDHVPPLFGFTSFAQVASNYGGGRSFKEAMQHLENSCRKIGDGFLHVQIRDRETLPAAQQVHFAAPLDLLLGEIVRKYK